MEATSFFPSGPILPLPAPFEDSRGVIQTLVEGGIHSVQAIFSKIGTVRANHYHKSDSHYMYVVSGKMKYFFRSAESQERPSWCFVNQGQLIFTPPLVEHAVEFLEDTLFLNITANSRDQTQYESDIVKVNLHKPFTP